MTRTAAQRALLFAALLLCSRAAPVLATVPSHGGTPTQHLYASRYYDPRLGRFISADTYDGKAWNLQSFNKYAYVLNNPYRYVDPDGHKERPPTDEERRAQEIIPGSEDPEYNCHSWSVHDGQGDPSDKRNKGLPRTGTTPLVTICRHTRCSIQTSPIRLGTS